MRAQTYRPARAGSSASGLKRRLTEMVEITRIELVDSHLARMTRNPIAYPHGASWWSCPTDLDRVRAALYY